MGTLLRVAMADDDAAVRSAISGFLSRQEGFSVVGEAADGLAATQLYLKTRPDVMLMDLNMPVRSGVEAIAAICDQDPGARVVALTTFDADEHIIAALRAGAGGYLLKDTRPAQLLAAIKAAYAGDMPLSPTVRRALVRSLGTSAGAPEPAETVELTARQQELLGWLAHGYTNQQIAERMHLSTGSVKQYLNQIGQRLDASSRTQILIRAVRLGLVDPNDALEDESAS